LLKMLNLKMLNLKMLKTRSPVSQSKGLQIVVFSFFALCSCNKSVDSFEILPEKQKFHIRQVVKHPKLDILWIVDNSRSMKPVQDSLSRNFHKFISKFLQYGYDFRMAVTTTEAYLAKDLFADFASDLESDLASNSFASQNEVELDAAILRTLDLNGKELPYMSPETPNLEAVFTKNILKGANGSPCEQIANSLLAVLKHPLNKNFFRADANLVIIPVTDVDEESPIPEKRQSWLNQGCKVESGKTWPKEWFVSLEYLIGEMLKLKGQAGTFSFHPIAVLDKSCQLGSESRPADRLKSLAALTNGKSFQLCEDYSRTLSELAGNVVADKVAFLLTRIPVPASIEVWVEGTRVEADPLNGWTYEEGKLEIVLHGNSIPAQDSVVEISYDPAFGKD
jgi:hypothetical protein